MTNTRTIIHLDLDAFFCAVEEQRDETLRGKAFAVGGRPDSRGVMSSASYVARRFGVRSAMPMTHAVRLCPNLIVVPPNVAAYRAALHEVMAFHHDLTPAICSVCDVESHR
jgi:DNA polymerase IV